MTEIARTATPISLKNAAALFVDAARAFDPNLSFETASFLMALVWNETGGGQKMNNYNWGNIAGEYQGDYFRPSWYDNPDSPLHTQMLAGKVPSKFRAYRTYTEGLKDYVSVLFKTFPSVVKAAGIGDPYSFAAAIYKSKYCPDEGCKPERMAASYQALARQVSADPSIAALPKGQAVSSTPVPAQGSSSGSPLSASSVSSSQPAAGEKQLPILRRGSQGSAVALWQSLIGVPLVDGRFGAQTERETLAYQRTHSYAGSPLIADGIVGDLSWLSVIDVLRRQQIIS